MNAEHEVTLEKLIARFQELMATKLAGNPDPAYQAKVKAQFEKDIEMLKAWHRADEDKSSQ